MFDVARQEPTWSQPSNDIRHRVHLGFVALSWLLCMAAAIVLATLLSVVLAAAIADPLADSSGFEASLIPVATGLMSFIAFFVVMYWRLQRIQGDRLLNSLAVAVLHVLALGLLLAVGAALQLEVSGMLPGGTLTELGVGLFALERSAATVILACLLAPGLMPASGPVPRRTQDTAIAEEHEL